MVGENASPYDRKLAPVRVPALLRLLHLAQKNAFQATCRPETHQSWCFHILFRKTRSQGPLDPFLPTRTGRTKCGRAAGRFPTLTRTGSGVPYRFTGGSRFPPHARTGPPQGNAAGLLHRQFQKTIHIKNIHLVLGIRPEDGLLLQFAQGLVQGHAVNAEQVRQLLLIQDIQRLA